MSHTWLENKTANVKSGKHKCSGIETKGLVRGSKKIAVEGDHYNEEGKSVDKKRSSIRIIEKGKIAARASGSMSQRAVMF